MKNLYILCTLVFGGFLMQGCTKYANPDPIYEEYELAPDSVKQRKVLFLVVDGAVGKEVQAIMPTNLKALTATSKYSFDAVSDAHSGDPASWTTMLTGVSSSIHHIVDDSYIARPSQDDPHANVEFLPSFLYHLKEQKFSMNIVTFVRDLNMSNALLIDATTANVLNSDLEVKNKLVENISTKNVDFVLAQFTDVLAAGTKSSFSATEPQFKEAVETVDGYIGEALAALQKRANYEREDWLVIIASSHGAVGNSYGGSSAKERNSFILYHNKNFTGEKLDGERLETVRFYGFTDPAQSEYKHMTKESVRARNLTTIPEEVNYNVANTGEITIEAKIKMNRNPVSDDYVFSTPPFLSKVVARTGNTAGWSFFRSGTNVVFFVADGTTKFEITAPASTAGEWAHITGTVGLIDGVPTAKLYINGKMLSSSAQATFKLVNSLSSSPLTFGHQPTVFLDSQPVDLQICDVKIWNKVLSDAEIATNANRVGLADNSALPAGLVGYWPMNDLDGIFKNKVPQMPNIPIQGDFQYTISGNDLPYLPADKALLFKSEDIASQVFYWFGIAPQKNWKLQGQPILSKFEIEFLKP